MQGVQENMAGALTTELSAIVTAYRDASETPLMIGQRLINYRNKHGISQQEVARQTGITPGTLHQLESLVRDLAPDLQADLETGRLAFKEARAIADIHDHERQREIAGPFLAGRLSSVYVEKVVRRAMTKPDETVDDVINAVLSHAKTVAVRRVLTLQTKRSVDVSLASIEADSLALAGTLDAVMAVEVPEYRRLKVAQAVSVLYTRAHKLLLHWQYTNHNGQNHTVSNPNAVLKATP